MGFFTSLRNVLDPTSSDVGDSGRLFGRTARVTFIRQPATSTDKLDPTTFFSQTGDTLEIEDLRIQFEVTKNLGKEPNKCKIMITNLSETTRGNLEKKPIRVLLHAGYAGVNKLLFVGDLQRSFSKRNGSDIITTIHVADGLRAYAHARMNHAYSPPISTLRVLSDAAKSMGLTLPSEVNQSSDLRQALASGISMHGPTRDVLTSLLAPYGYGWSIQNSQLTLLREEDVRAGQEFVVDQSTGLVGSPESTEPEKPGGKSEIKFVTLLYPELNPGSVADLESEFLSHKVKITDVTHKGDTHPGSEWQTEVASKQHAKGKGKKK